MMTINNQNEQLFTYFLQTDSHQLNARKMFAVLKIQSFIY